MDRLGDELHARLQKAAEGRAEKRKNTLFGSRLLTKIFLERSERIQCGPRNGFAGLPDEEFVLYRTPL
jgi:hypothetical protein